MESSLPSKGLAPTIRRSATNNKRGIFFPLSTDSELPALDALRLVAVIHIVALHYHRTNHLTLWGSSWITFLFLMSGFGAAYTRLQRGVWSPGLLPRSRTVIRRWASVYPLYAFGLLWDAALIIGANPPRTDDQKMEVAKQLAVNLSMTQAYFSNGQYSSLYNPPGWFCSALLLLWLLEEAFCSLAATCWRRGVRGRLIAVFGAGLWVLVWPFARFPLTGGRLTAFHQEVPGLQYIHVFFIGCFLALPVRDCLDSVLASLARKSPLSSMPTGHAALLLGMAFTLMTNFHFIQNWGPFLALPLQCVLVYGTYVTYDPLVLFLSALPSPNKVVFAAYVLQAPTARMLKGYMDWQAPLFNHQFFLLIIVLLIVSYLAQEMVQRPLGPLLCRLAS